jgi:hypothetical protein
VEYNFENLSPTKQEPHMGRIEKIDSTLSKTNNTFYLLFTDETNQQPSDASLFFIYGGVFVPIEKLTDLHNLVEKARSDNGYRPADEFKFSPSSRPQHVTYEQFKEAKRTVLLGCSNMGLKFSAYLTLHQIAQNRSLEELISWGANTIIAKFDSFLEEEKTTGGCIVDRLPFDGNYQFLQQKFQTGLTFPDGNTQRLKNVLLFTQSTIGASHAMSAIDIILGSFRYCVNERHRSIAPREILPMVVKMMWYKKFGDFVIIRDYGLIFRPKKVQVQEYQKSYNDLVEHLTNLISPMPPKLESHNP